MPEGISGKKLKDPKFKGCEIKRPFATEADAEKAIDNAGLTKSGWRRGGSYKCRYCESWHITSRKRRKPL